MLIELSKVNAPSLLLEDFNYFFNKAINQYINKRYGIYDVNQQTTDDLRVLKATAILKPKEAIPASDEISDVGNFGAGLSKIFGGTYEVNLPLDYLHMLNCICIYRVDKRYKCYNSGDHVQFAAKRLTADSWPTIVNDFYNRPAPQRPYYYINNVNTSADLPTNPVDTTEILTRTSKGTDARIDYMNSTDAGASNLPRKISLDGIANKDVVEREAGMRYGNASGVRCEIRYGHDNTVFKLEGVLIDYIKSPQVIRLTLEQVNLTEDTSQIMEFPDYVCQEIINELTLLVMENTADPRLLTNPIVSQSIANPAQQLTQQPQARRRG